ncbi:MAG TPA: hypothetical protein VGO04_24435 [Ensifer sp.]|jgi:fructose-1,6-bisphosphatase|uniref:hypothetical protein n=1 Tax=Ensifer sp. TaxID=1872086 RepID=UPI002E0F90E5|nr:hypothetical protein [Ensifer sp.]
MKQESDGLDPRNFTVTNSMQFREALARLRMLAAAQDSSTATMERDAWELAVSRYIAKLEREHRR